MGTTLNGNDLETLAKTPKMFDATWCYLMTKITPGAQKHDFPTQWENISKLYKYSWGVLCTTATPKAQFSMFGVANGDTQA